ncbi:hypothetical protein Cch01nite_13530 [Cellulomonas chitinilytica]|uniref:Uncharacterized protein n=1 Tax=Cellulomonas chitinilytica TaxID=398759 RepID=A0A919P394_9CELL|nr:hypothetical protein [Cellulomonas chitinilytica]GIG20629.1 hypothetical protein Cch01nite_13530 [Cellulomonas chitinilytica]
MGWGATLLPLSGMGDAWEWLAECAVDPLPEAPPPPGAPVGAADVLRLLRAAGLSGSTSPLVDDALDHLRRDDAEDGDEDDAWGETALTCVFLIDHTEPGEYHRPPERLDPGTPVVAIGLDKPHPHAALRAAAALVPVWGPTVAMEDSGCRSIVVDGPIGDLAAATDRWLDH